MNTHGTESSMSPAWLFLGLAVALETTGAIGLRFSVGFTQVLPTTVALIAFALALYLVSHVMRRLPVSIAYPVWAGGGTAGVALVGILALGEELSILKFLGVTFIMIGVIIVNMVPEKTSGC